MDEEELTAYEYLTYPLVELMTHPNYSARALVVTAAFLKMNTPELEVISTHLLNESN